MKIGLANEHKQPINCMMKSIHYSGVIMVVMASQINSLAIFTQPFIRAQIKENIKAVCVTGLCAGISPGTGGFPAQMANNAENVSIWWRHHVHVP